MVGYRAREWRQRRVAAEAAIYGTWCRSAGNGGPPRRARHGGKHDGAGLPPSTAQALWGLSAGGNGVGSFSGGLGEEIAGGVAWINAARMRRIRPPDDAAADKVVT